MPGATRRSASRRCSTKLGYKLTDPGRYQNLTDNFTAQITAFKSDDCEIVTGVVLPPDFTTFWNQALPAGFQAEDRLGRQGDAVPGRGRGARARTATISPPEVWWSPSHPFKSSLTGQSARETSPPPTRQATSKQWTQPIGFVHALFEVAVDVLKRSADVERSERDRRRRSRATNLDTIVGPLAMERQGRCRRSRRRTSPRRRWSAANGGCKDGGELRYRHHRQPDRARNPVAGKMEAIG